jgi:hypothetical protein
MRRGPPGALGLFLLLGSSCSRLGFDVLDVELTCKEGSCADAAAGDDMVFTRACLEESVPHLRIIDVSTSTALTGAIAAALPGDLIRVADGSYDPVSITVSGTAANPIYLCGTRDAVLAGTGVERGVDLGASYWNIVGLSITNTFEGLVGHDANFNTVRELEVFDTLSTGLKLFNISSDNVFEANWLHDIAVADPNCSEGIIIGHYADRNQVLANTVEDTGYESIDVRGDTTATVVQYNTFRRPGLCGIVGADAFVAVRGNDTQVLDNEGFSAPRIGMQVWPDDATLTYGHNNLFRGNVMDLQPPPAYLGVHIRAGYEADNYVYCDNVMLDGLPLTNVTCTP